MWTQSNLKSEILIEINTCSVFAFICYLVCPLRCIRMFIDSFAKAGCAERLHDVKRRRIIKAISGRRNCGGSAM
jgi:hypothetical protein